MSTRNRFLFSLIPMVLIFFILAPAAESRQLIRIATESPGALEALRLPKGMEPAGFGMSHRDFIADGDQVAELRRRGIPFEVLDHDITITLRNNRAGYHTLAEMENELQTIAANHPSITDLFSMGKSYQNRDIWCLEITDNPGVGEGEPELLFIGLHHAREWPSLEMGLYIANMLTSNYGSDPDITDWVNTRRIWVITCLNPDGYYYCHDQGHDWRKNRHYLPQFNSTGVDLNRNYPGATSGNHHGDWGSIGAASVTHHYDQEIYCGPGAGSELETQAVMDFLKDHEITALLSYHTYSELVLWPWNYTTGTAPDNGLLKSTGQAMANLITKQSGSGKYAPMQGSGLYPTTGDTTDWAYGYYHYVQGKNILPYTIEMCSSFQPSSSKLPQILGENWDAVEYLLDEADSIKNSMTPFVLPPLLDAPDLDPDGNYTVVWTEKNPDANATKFRLDELTGPSFHTDGAESGTGLWNMNGFSISSSKKYAGSYSFKSKYGNASTSSFTTTHPLMVEAGDKLTFWTWYDIETDWDFAFVDVSRDQRFWEQLDAFTGSSSGWKNKQYSLDAYAGEAIYVRFRYTTDEYTQGQGFFVDEISPVPDFAGVVTLSDNITNTYYDVTGKGDGDYYYRVKGYNPTKGWGDFCDLDMTKVEIQTGPEVFDVTPSDGLMAGGTSVTVSGVGFTSSGDTDVFFGGEGATSVNVLNQATLTCTTPAFPHPGFVDVAVQNSAGTGTLTDGFEYVPGAGPPLNVTDKDTLNLNPPEPVNFYVTGNPSDAFLLFLSFGGGPVNTPYGTMGLNPPVILLFGAALGSKGYIEITFDIPTGVGPLEFYMQALVNHGGTVLWAVGGNNPNGSGSVKFVLP